MAKISKETSRILNRALLSLITGFVFTSIYFEKSNSWPVLMLAIPAFISGIYYLSTAYRNIKNAEK